MIVGSAPVSPGLLENFRSIGIEIHNAYGLTEAPLITLNRYMDNRIDTVGEALPDTEVRISDDGEIHVRGPQVMAGYYHDTEPVSVENGWLHTGDYGNLIDGKYLVISGRKKEVIIDSYGKNINPSKIEMMLRDTTGIDHIMLFGDQKPYCVALFWGCRPDDSQTADKIEAGIRQVNQQLSHPEQIKKWALFAEELSIEDGELTANLKMKRSSIALKYADEIERLYQ